MVSDLIDPIYKYVIFLLIAGKGIGSFVGGQISTLVGTPNLFKLTGASAIVSGTLVIIAYHMFGKKWEKKVLEEKSMILREMELRELSDTNKVEENGFEKAHVTKM